VGAELTMIDQIRHLQSRVPFEPFALELSSGRIIQIEDRHRVATAADPNGGAVIGVLYGGGRFEVIDAGQLLSVSSGIHPKVKEELSKRMEDIRKRSGPRPPQAPHSHD
jgi:hypothetical protein